MSYFLFNLLFPKINSMVCKVRLYLFIAYIYNIICNNFFFANIKIIFFFFLFLDKKINDIYHSVFSI